MPKSSIKSRLKNTAIYSYLRERRFLYTHRQERRFYAQFIRAGDLCFDVGANQGQKTALLLSLGARVVCIEPQSNMLEILRRRFGNDPRVSIQSNALGSEEGEAILNTFSKLPEISSLSPEWVKASRFALRCQPDGFEKVRVTTLDKLISLHGCPSFCKIDVEGFEQAVLAGLNQKLETISFEFNKEFLESAKLCMQRIRSIGSAKFNYVRGEPTKLVNSQWLSAEVIFQQIAGDPDPLAWGDILARMD